MKNVTQVHLSNFQFKAVWMYRLELLLIQFKELANLPINII